MNSIYKGGKAMQKWIVLIVIVIIVIIGGIVVFNVDIETEYVPEVEIEEKELRKTLITLYFYEKDSGEISKESRMIDSKELLKNPYKSILDMLLTGPENENCENVIPEGTTINDVTFDSGCVNINFSKEFAENLNQETKIKNIEAIKKTLMELTEVTNIKIFVENSEIEI